MPFIPFAATVGGWLGATGATAATIGGAAIVATAATVAGIATTATAMSAQAKNKVPGIADFGPAPSEKVAEDTARQQQIATRRAILGTGGVTTYAGFGNGGKGAGGKATTLG